MHHYYYTCPYMNFTNLPIDYTRQYGYPAYPHGYAPFVPNNHLPLEETRLKDYGKQPYVINIEEAAKRNNNFRTAIWTGDNLQVTVMSIPVGGDVGLEVHPDVDQFLRIEEGQGVVQMGNTESNLNFQRQVTEDYAIMVPAGKWHNLINTGNIPLKLYTIYAPPEHPFGTIHRTQEESMAAEKY
ncbi:cupin domain-containing protein [Virgibacillus halodenitrificans]|uniref:cupin domain-containing protein n=1 Tax=Virgibacillus halodenitrificans TaxID=1482 RepID=UPI0024BFF03E|nr:cupin domain-containing protein [Virgibacillus halodenitrificans]WHX24546.1 cupin domain-containing protein [Virgibacillus halodenitrificans]